MVLRCGSSFIVIGENFIIVVIVLCTQMVIDSVNVAKNYIIKSSSFGLPFLLIEQYTTEALE